MTNSIRWYDFDVYDADVLLGIKELANKRGIEYELTKKTDCWHIGVFTTEEEFNVVMSFKKSASLCKEVDEDEIKEIIENKIDDAIFSLQNKYGIENGEADFSMVFDLDEKLEELSKIVKTILEYQRTVDRVNNDF